MDHAPAVSSSSEVLEDIYNNEICVESNVESSMCVLGLAKPPAVVCSSPIAERYRLFSSAFECSLAEPKKKRSINTCQYPGNLFEFMGDCAVPEKGVPASALWRNLGRQREDEMYIRHIRLPRAALEDLVQRCRLKGPGGEQDTAFLNRSDKTVAAVSGKRSYDFRRIVILTLYFLAHSSTAFELSTVFGVPPSSAWTLVGEGVLALVRVLLHGVGGNKPLVAFPSNDTEKLSVIGGFEELIGHLPWCIGAIDGTHIGQRKPDVTRVPMGRDLYWSWKSKVSQLLVWIVDARARAIYASAGHPGCSSDAGVWTRDPLRRQCDEQDLLKTPLKEFVCNDGSRMSLGPYFVGDGAFQLRPYMMTCYGEDNTHAKRIFNQAVYDVRKVVEQAIGRLKMTWQFCHRNLFHGDTEFVRNCIEACVGLHNLRMDYNVTCDEGLVSEFVQKELGGVTGNGTAAGGVGEGQGERIRHFLAAYLMHQES